MLTSRLQAMLCVVLGLSLSSMATATPATQPTQHRLTAPIIAQLVEQTKIQLKPVRVQWLPPTVRLVRTGLDGRQWYALYPADWTPTAVGPADIAAIEKEIEGQFDKPAPKVVGVRPVLFEPDGRVWFIVEPGHVLLSYAGKPGQWIRHDVTDRPFRGTCNGPANPSGREAHNVVMGRYRLFIAGSGVHVFDGKHWSYQSFTAGRKQHRVETRTAVVAPDGKSALFCVANKAHPLWRFQDGKWTALPGPKRDVGQAHHGLRSAVPLADGRVLVYGDHGVALVQPANWKPTTQPAPKAKAKSGFTPDFAWDEEPTVDLTDAKIQKQTDGMAMTPDGTVFLTGAYFNPGGTGTFGLAMLLPGQPPNKARLVAGRKIGGRLMTAEAGNVVWVNPHTLYLPGSFTTDPGVVNFSAQPAEYIPLPNPYYHSMQTVDEHGRLFLGFPPYQNQRNPQVMVEDMAAPANHADDLKMNAFSLIRGNFWPHCFASDGSLWAVLADSGLCRIEGDEWTQQATPHRKDGKIRGLVPGDHGAMLVISGTPGLNPKKPLYTLQSKKWKLFGDDLRTMIRDFPTAFCRAFAHPLNPVMQENQVGWGHMLIQADPAGDIWLVRANRVDLLADGRWHEVYSGKQIENATALGDGSVLIFVPDGKPPQAAQWKNGKLVVKTIALPKGKVYVQSAYETLLRGPDGSVWLGLEQDIDRPGDNRHYHALHIKPNGTTELLRDVGWPRVIEADGTVWLGGCGDRSGDGLADRYAIYRDGKIVQRVRVPRNRYYTQFFSDRPGSVWAWSKIGLTHMVADDPAHPGRYRVDRRWRPVHEGGQMIWTELGSSTNRIMVSPTGVIAVVGTRYAGAARRHEFLYVAQLPGTPAHGNAATQPSGRPSGSGSPKLVK